MITEKPASWDVVTDVVVVGSGGAAMTAATLAADGGASVLVVEKADALGGTTGVSGGVMWLPNNHHIAEAGDSDSRDDALAYIHRIADGREPDPSLVEVFVDTAPEMLAYLEAKTPLKMQPVKNFPDYYWGRDLPGVKGGNRSVEPSPYPARAELGDWTDRVATRSTLLTLGASTTLTEDLSGSMTDPDVRTRLAHREREGVRVKGAAFISALLKGLLDRGVDLRTGHRARDLVVVDGAVIGLRCETADGDVLIGARRGVILACGGFEWNRDMVRGFIGYEIQPLSPGSNEGDGHQMAMEAGARLANMMSYWGQGALFDPAITWPDGSPAAQMNAPMMFPGAFVVNQHGVRFFNENATYNDWPKGYGVFDERYPGFPNKAPGWLIFDEEVKRTSPILTVGPQDLAPDWFQQAGSASELADKIGVPAEALESTLMTFNDNAAKGSDPEFGRRLLRPLSGTLYALQMFPATLGTNGGCRIDADGRVLGYRREVIDGLYAAGNTAAGVFGWAYVGGGTPIGLGATFGYLAGRHAATRPPRDI
jgi:succinate dehydrogenase/fumarate reductase flavoprotein subunit